MGTDEPLDDIAIDVADGRTIDWHARIARAQTEEERAQLEHLRIISAIAQLHRPPDAALTDPALSEGSATTQAPESRPPGQAPLWGKYQLVEEVGSGSFGRVYRAWDPELRRHLAIKILHRVVTDERLKERLLAEGRALAGVDSTNVVTVYGTEAHGDRVGLCMEFVHGETLQARLKASGTSGAREAVLVGLDVCRALAAVHKAGLVHRDVKAHNIMRERGTGRIVLMDFGTGRQAEELRQSSAENVAGTPLYMAPEVAAEQPASATSDVYSVGVLLYHLVTGEYPVQGRTLAEIRAAHMLGRRTPLSERAPDLPIPFIRVVERALAADPQQRYPSAGTFLDALAEIDTGVAQESPWKRRILVSTLAVTGSVSGFIALGAISSRYFNATLDRLDFANEGVLDWLYWGAIATVAPLVLLTVALLALTMLSACGRLLARASTTARRVEATMLATIHRLRLDEVATLAPATLLFSASLLIATWLYLQPMLSRFVDLNVSTTPAQLLAFLSPENFEDNEAYRKVLIWVTIACGLSWYVVLRQAAVTGESLNRGVVTGGAAVMLLAILLLDFPYRLLTYTRFDVAHWRGETCYILGERGDDVLLFCPQLPPPRNRIIRKASDELKRADNKEDIFTNVKLAK